MERTKRKSSVYNDYVPYGGRVPNFKEKEGMKLKKEQFDVTGMTCSACSARIVFSEWSAVVIVTIPAC